jgi:1,4-dihydroxy-2-naphthoate octaprenyltransferase
MRAWFLAMRPKTWIASISPVLLGTTIARQEGIFHPLLLFYTLLTALGIQITTNLTNDYFDFLKGADTAERKGSVRVMQAGLVTRRAMCIAITLSALATLALGCTLIYRGGGHIAYLLILSLILAFFYTAGPYPLAYLGIAELFVLIFYGPVAVAATHYLQTLHLSMQAVVAGLCVGLFSTAILVANNIRDVDEDLKAQKKTLPVRWGRLFGKIEYSTAVLGAPLPLLFFCKKHPFLWLACLIWIPVIPLLRTLFRTQAYDHVFIQTSKLLWLFTLMACLGWIF